MRESADGSTERALKVRPQPQIPLSVHHLTFHCRAREPILWHPFKGSAVRGAFAGVLRRTFCPEGRDASGRGEADKLHASVCPVCQLLAMPQEEEADGDLRRPYAVRPPLDRRTRYAAGEPFAFTVTLFGEQLGYLPYLALGAEGMGAGGIGRKEEGGRRGRFTIEAITSTNPLTKTTAMLMKPGERMVQAVTAAVDNAQVTAAAAELAERLEAAGNRLTLNFATPTRLIKRQGTVAAPEPFQLIKNMALRILDLSAQYGGGRPTMGLPCNGASGRALELKRDLFPHADAVALVDDGTRWWDVSGYSGRLRQTQRLGGFIGSATYTAPDWRPLLPWLLWAAQVQIGKNTVKGCGVVELSCALQPFYGKRAGAENSA